MGIPASAGRYFDCVEDNLSINSQKGMNQGGKHWDNVKSKGLVKYRPRGSTFDRLQRLQASSFWGDFKKSTRAIIESLKN